MRGTRWSGRLVGALKSATRTLACGWQRPIQRDPPPSRFELTLSPSRVAPQRRAGSYSTTSTVGIVRGTQ